VLTEDPDVWAKTVLILCYDEEGGFFDHVLPPVAPASRHDGFSSVSTAGEISKGEAFGLGARLPFIIASPWTRGGYVCSEVFDHTSIIRFLEKRFGVMEPNISAWRRSICGDLSSMFDFSQSTSQRPQALFDTAHQTYIQQAQLSCEGNKSKETPRVEQLVRQEADANGNTRPARPLPYQCEVNAQLSDDKEGFQIRFNNLGKVGAAFTVFAHSHNAGPWYYTLGSQQQFTENWPLVDFGSDKYALRVHGPNGFLRIFQGRSHTQLSLSVSPDLRNNKLRIHLNNQGDRAFSIQLRDNFYGASDRQLVLESRSTTQLDWECQASAHWYDFAVTIAEEKDFLWRYAGHLETGKNSLSDPANGMPQKR
jgi:phospholipase C